MDSRERQALSVIRRHAAPLRYARRDDGSLARNLSTGRLIPERHAVYLKSSSHTTPRNARFLQRFLTDHPQLYMPFENRFATNAERDDIRRLSLDGWGELVSKATRAAEATVQSFWKRELQELYAIAKEHFSHNMELSRRSKHGHANLAVPSRVDNLHNNKHPHALRTRFMEGDLKLARRGYLADGTKFVKFGLPRGYRSVTLKGFGSWDTTAIMECVVQCADGSVFWVRFKEVGEHDAVPRYSWVGPPNKLLSLTKQVWNVYSAAMSLWASD